MFGYPVIEALLGSAVMPAVVLLDVLNTLAGALWSGTHRPRDPGRWGERQTDVQTYRLQARIHHRPGVVNPGLLCLTVLDS